MAGVGWKAVTAKIATGTSLKTLMQVVAAANHRLLVKEFGISFDGVASDGVPILVEVLRQSTAGTTSALTPVKTNDSDDETLQVTARHTATVEPTAGDVLWSEQIHPQTGDRWVATFDDPLPVKGGGRLGLRVTAAAGVNAVAYMSGTE